MANNQSISESFKLINRYAMHYGLLLGLFWVIRYAFLIVAGIGISDRFAFIFYLLNIVTLLVVYIFYYKFKTADPDNPKNAWQCIAFTILMCFFASFLEGAVMYAHFQFIDPAYFTHLIQPFIKSIDATPKMGFISDAEFAEVKKIMVSIYSSKLTYIVFEFIKNVFLGLFLSVMLNFVVKVNKSK